MPSKRLFRRAAVVVLGVLALGEMGTGIAAARHQRAVQAEARAAAAYVAAVRPLANRAFDAVQPIQDALDGWGKRRPGIWTATEDVVRRSGAERELVAVDKELTRLTVPATHQQASVAIETAIKALTTSVRELGKAMVATKRSSPACSTCDEEDAFVQAGTNWGLALDKLGATPRMPAPAVQRAGAEGRKAATWGGYMVASDLACGLAQQQLFDLPDHTNETWKNLPAKSKILRTQLASLRRLSAPASRRVLEQRLDKELQAVSGLAVSMDKIYKTLVANDREGVLRGLEEFDQGLVELRDLSATYKKAGILNCATIFQVDDKDLPKEYGT
jgi:hypothetical protein